MSFPSARDTVAINGRSAEECLFIRSISQTEHIMKPMKSWSACCDLRVLSAYGFVFACVVLLSIRAISNHLSRTRTAESKPRLSLRCVLHRVSSPVLVRAHASMYARACVAAEGTVQPVSAGENKRSILSITDTHLVTVQRRACVCIALFLYCANCICIEWV